MEHSSYNGKDDFMSTYIKADQFYYPHKAQAAEVIELVDGKFGTCGKFTRRWMCWIFRLQHCAWPVDHIHLGFGGVDVMDNNIEGTSIPWVKGSWVQVTSFLPTTLTSSYEQLLGSNWKYRCTMQQQMIVTIEGPYLWKYMEVKPSYMKDPSMENSLQS